MKRIILISFVVLLAAVILYPISMVFADPHLTCDSYVSGSLPTEFELYLDGTTTPIISSAQPDINGGVRLYYDLSSITTGEHTVIVKAALVDPLWGRMVSDPSIPFVFTRPSAPISPSIIRLIK